MTNQRLRSHPLYAEYAKMRIRERELLRDEKELKKEGIRSADFLKAWRTFALSRKKLDGVKKVLSED